MHVHDLDVLPLREEVDADDGIEATPAEPVELERVPAADAQDDAAARPCVGNPVDQRDGADAGIGLPLREGPPELDFEVVAILGRVSLREAPQPEPVRHLADPSHTGAKARPYVRTTKAQRSATEVRHAWRSVVSVERVADLREIERIPLRSD